MSNQRRRHHRKRTTPHRPTPNTSSDYTSPDDLHLFFVEGANLHVMLCDACMAEQAMAYDDDPEHAMQLRVLTPCEENRALAATGQSGNDMCGGHQHAVCDHLYWRLPMAPMTDSR